MRAVIRSLRNKLRDERVERLLIKLRRDTGAWYHPLAVKMSPQPGNYARDEFRRVERLGFNLKLYPANYFQWHHYFQVSDPVLRTLEHLAPHARDAVDAGANVALYSLVLSRRVSGRVFAFEPNPPTNAMAANHIALNNIQNIELSSFGLSDSAGVAALDSHTEDLGKFSLRVQQSGLGAQTIDIRTLDALLGGRDDLHIDLIKIDVEGLDFAVIRGARELIATHRPVMVVEISFGDLSPADHATFDELRELGYVVVRVGDLSVVTSLRASSIDQQNMIFCPHDKLHLLDGLR
jgi:FkbM family methyltransferase